MPIPAKLQRKVASAIRMLLSDRDEDIIAAVCGLKRLIDIHTLAEHIELSKEEMNRIFEAGRAQGIADVERRQIEAINAASNNPDWTTAVRILQQFKHYFGSERIYIFIDRMTEKADDDDEPTHRELGFIFSLHAELKEKAREQARIKAMSRRSK